LYYLRTQKNIPFNPYDNLKDTQLVQRPKAYFAVVRNPYDRLLSSFHMNHKAKQCNFTKEDLNRRTIEWLTQVEDGSEICNHACAFLPQTTYLYDRPWNETLAASIGEDDGALAVIDHILRFENLTSDLDVLTQHVYPSLQLPKLVDQPMNVNQNSCPKSSKRRIQDFNLTALAIIHRVYARDFAELGYPLYSKPRETPLTER
jgi:hypothetical protein